MLMYFPLEQQQYSNETLRNTCKKKTGCIICPPWEFQRIRAGEPLASSAKLFLKRWKHLNDREGSLQGYLHSHNLRYI